MVGGKPWRVRVTGEASEWELGAVPVTLRGADEPHWLQGRTDALRVAIYRRLKAYAVPLKTSIVGADGFIQNLVPLADPVLEGSAARPPDESVDRPQERRECLARAGGGGDQGVVPRGDGAPALSLGRRRRAKALAEPVSDEGVERRASHGRWMLAPPSWCR